MKRHPLDLTALIWGVLFLLVSVAVLLDEYTGADLELKWLVPASLIVAGIGGIANALRSLRTP